MWITLHNFTLEEVVLTTYMIVVLFLERPALLSAPRPQTSPSSCTTLQLLNWNLYREEKARMQVAHNADSVNSAKSRLYLGFVSSATFDYRTQLQQWNNCLHKYFYAYKKPL